MPRVRIGNYVYFNNEEQSPTLLPLLECLRFAVDRGRPVDYYLRGILLEAAESSPAGGDPGWSIHWIPEASEALFPDDWKRCMAEVPTSEGGCFEAWTHQPFSDLDPPYAYYPKHVVHHYVREVLNNFRALHPQRATEVDVAIESLGLLEP